MPGSRRRAGRTTSLTGRPRTTRGSRASTRRRRRGRQRSLDGGLGDARGRARAQVIRRLQAFFPGVEVHRGELADARALDEEVERLALIEEGSAVGGHVDERAHQDLPGGAVDGADVGGQLLDALHRALGDLDPRAHRLVPAAERLEVGDEVAVDLEEVARERLALEEVGDLRLDAFAAAGDGGDRRCRRDGDEERVAEARGLDASAQRVPARGIGGRDAPRVELELALRRARLGEGRVRAALGGELARGRSAWK